MPGTGADPHHEKATYDRFGRPFQFFDASRTQARFDFNGVRHAYNANGYLERLQDAEGTFDGQGTFTPNAVHRTVTAMDADGDGALDYLRLSDTVTRPPGCAEAVPRQDLLCRILRLVQDNQLLAHWDVLCDRHGNTTPENAGCSIACG
ncbi:MAG: hypothetical protein OXP11_05200 [Gammaproteobacteria bacterium]|nr:hypothetical protein [Gammaproteobacteria bacterium]